MIDPKVVDEEYERALWSGIMEAKAEMCEALLDHGHACLSRRLAEFVLNEVHVSREVFLFMCGKGEIDA